MKNKSLGWMGGWEAQYTEGLGEGVAPLLCCGGFRVLSHTTWTMHNNHNQISSIGCLMKPLATELDVVCQVGNLRTLNIFRIII